MADRRRRRRVKSDEDSEDLSLSESVSLSEPEGEDEVDQPVKSSSSDKLNEVEKIVGESEYESAEEEDGHPKKVRRKPSVDDFDSPTDLIDEEGGEEGIADADVEGEFLDGDASEDDDDDYVEEERQQGDGEECSSSNAPEKVLDLDEDRRNPQYIPKKGTFYEHDDRNNDDSPKEKEVESSRDKKKKKLWLDEGRWGHDRYREEEQAPKSRDELIEIYGYDIRCEDGPPRARRRRRYGRGPTKYQRNWEDAAAYGRERGTGMFRGYTRRGRGRPRGRSTRGRGGYRGRGGRFYRTSSRDDEIDRNSSNKIGLSNSDIVQSIIDTTEQNSENKEVEEPAPVINKMDFPALPTKEPSPQNEIIIEQTVSNRKSPVRETPVDNSVRSQTFENSNLSNNRPAHYNGGPPRRGKNSSYRGNFRNEYRKPTANRGPRGRGRGRGFYAQRGDGDVPRNNIPPRLMDAQLSAIHTAMEKLTVSEKVEQAVIAEDPNSNVQESSRPPANIQLNGNKQQNIVSVAASKAGGDSSSRPKRYSSLRQRSLPETSVYQPSPPPVPQPHPSYYDASYQTIYATPETVTASPQPQTPGSPPIITQAPPPPPPAYQTFPPPYQDGYAAAMRMPVNSPPRVFPQVTLATGQPMLGAPCITPSANLMNFAAPPPPPASYATYTYPQYTTPPPPPPPGTQPPSDLYGAGITYYYTQGQSHPVRPVPQKRPKAAIPIVPPPENEVKVDRKDIQKLEVCNGNLTEINTSAEVSSPVVRPDAPAVQIQSAVEVES